MVGPLSEFDPLRHGEAAIFFDTEKVVSAAEVARLLSVISSEYARINKGHSLVVVRLETGSLYVIFKGVLAAVGPVVQHSKKYIDAATACINFFAKIRQITEHARERPAIVESNRAGFRTVREIVKVAAGAGAALELDYEARGGERLKFKMGATEVQAIENEVIADRRNRQQYQQLPSPLPLAMLPGADLERFDGTAFTDAIGDGPLSEEAQRIIKAMVFTMYRVGFAGALAEIADDLIGRGRADIAAVVISEMQRLTTDSGYGSSIALPPKGV